MSLNEQMQKVCMIAAGAMAKEVVSAIPSWVKQEAGAWYSENYGFTGPLAYLSPEMLNEVDLTLTQFVDALLLVQNIDHGNEPASSPKM